MIEAKYFKDYNHNYVILKCEDAEPEGNYQQKMLASNKIDGLLKCSVRNINGAAYFYYDISSKVTLENLYQGKKMSYEQVKDLFHQIDMIYRHLGEFFMEETGLLVQPGYVYYDFASKKYSGLYYPQGDMRMEAPYEPLMDFLLNHVDTGNQKLVDMIYRIYEMSEEQYFSMAEALLLFEDAEAEISSARNVVEGSPSGGENNGQNVMAFETAAVSEISTASDTAAAPLWLNDKDYDRNYDENHDRDEETSFSSESGIRTNQSKKSIYYNIFAVLALCGIGGSCWIYFNFELTQQEWMMVVCCSVLMGVCFLFSLVQILLSGQRNRKREQEERELRKDIEDEFRDERPVVLQDVLDKNMNLEAAGNYSVYQSAEFERVQQRNGRNERQTLSREVSEEQYGETIFIDVQKQNMEYKLYSLDKKNKKHIELTQFPFTIGKMAGCVDCVLMDDSVSRLHARIEKQDEKILLTDMNSKNGTYKNGLRMEPSETVEIEPGDEIRFGKLNYCYR